MPRYGTAAPPLQIGGVVKRPFATRLPRSGVWYFWRSAGWYWYTDRRAWGRPVRYRVIWFPGGAPASWRALLLNQGGAREVKKPEATGPARRRPYLDDPDFAKDYPKLAEALFSSSYETGEKKGCGVLIIKPRRWQASVVLKIEESGLMLSVDSPSIAEAFLALETLLRLDVVPWEEDPYANARKGPPKKSA
jgi:hypothetical protein